MVKPHKLTKKTIVKLSYKISNLLKNSATFEVMLLANTQNNEILGMGKLHLFHPYTKIKETILTNFKGSWNNVNQENEHLVQISLTGTQISPTIRNGRSTIQKNTLIQLSLESDWKSGVASFKYCLDNEWFNGGFIQAQHEGELDKNTVAQLQCA